MPDLSDARLPLHIYLIKINMLRYVTICIYHNKCISKMLFKKGKKWGNFMHFIVAACLLQFRGYFLTKLYLNGLNRLLQIFSSKTASFKYSSLDCRLWHFLLTMSKLELFVAANERGKYFWKFVLGNVYVGDDCTMC